MKKRREEAKKASEDAQRNPSRGADERNTKRNDRSSRLSSSNAESKEGKPTVPRLRVPPSASEPSKDEDGDGITDSEEEEKETLIDEESFASLTECVRLEPAVDLTISPYPGQVCHILPVSRH
jgi:hypothetical protein